MIPVVYPSLTLSSKRVYNSGNDFYSNHCGWESFNDRARAISFFVFETS